LRVLKQGFFKMKFSKVLMACLLVTTTSFVVAVPPTKPNQLCFPGGKPVPPGYKPSANDPKPKPCPNKMVPTQPGAIPMTPNNMPRPIQK
jgi:hypothetical protein